MRQLFVNSKSWYLVFSYGDQIEIPWEWSEDAIALTTYEAGLILSLKAIAILLHGLHRQSLSGYSHQGTPVVIRFDSRIASRSYERGAIENQAFVAGVTAAVRAEIMIMSGEA